MGLANDSNIFPVHNGVELGVRQEMVSFFESFEWEDALRLLRDAKYIMMQHKFAGMEYSIEEENVRFFFEKLEKLLAAAWIMAV